MNTIEKIRLRQALAYLEMFVDADQAGIVTPPDGAAVNAALEFIASIEAANRNGH